jgi:tRNA(Ile)-lysidine synthase TilS/MesJ
MIIHNGINFGFENNQFYVEYSCSRSVGNLREEFDKRAVDLYQKNPKQMLGLSTGLDSQAVLHSFITQGIPIEVAFLYLKGSNDNELERLRKLEKKYGIKSIIIEMDANEKKEEMLELNKQTGIPPYQHMHTDFLNQLPKDYDFIQGIHGPDLLSRDGTWYMLETANSFEIARLRALKLSDRSGDIIGWERTGEILLSLLTDDVVQAFLYAHPYIKENGLRDSNGENIRIIDYWDLYIKPFIYGKYWQGELEYYPKYQGPEKIDWIMNTKWHKYSENLVVTPLDKIISHLSKYDGTVLRSWQRSDNN